MTHSAKSIVGFLILFVFVGTLAGEAGAQGRTKIRYALGDVVSIDELPLLIAVVARQGARRQCRVTGLTARKSRPKP